MPEEKSNIGESEKGVGNDYQAPEVEEVITREKLEREVAYAGIIGGSGQQN